MSFELDYTIAHCVVENLEVRKNGCRLQIKVWTSAGPVTPTIENREVLVPDQVSEYILSNHPKSDSSRPTYQAMLVTLQKLKLQLISK